MTETNQGKQPVIIGEVEIQTQGERAGALSLTEGNYGALLLFLAQHPEERLATQTIATETGLKTSTVRNNLLNLATAGLVGLSRGKAKKSFHQITDQGQFVAKNQDKLPGVPYDPRSRERVLRALGYQPPESKSE